MLIARPRLTVRLLALALIGLAVGGCSSSVTAKGPGSLVEQQVAEAMLAPWPEKFARTVGAGDPMEGAAANFDPSRGQLAFVVQGADVLAEPTCVEITITPWDERPDVVRTIKISAWHWNFFPPGTKGPDGTVQRQVVERLAQTFGAPTS
ncbi:MAG: hypothetical protein FJ257_02165 [Phycisphaerae bacterium]|nr:hypothetical protein [Phycisphaerae bacterium]